MEIERHGDRIYVTSERDSGTLYEIKLKTLIGRPLCSCPDFQYRKYPEGKDCKHIKFVKMMLLSAVM